ncbi:tyrosine-type recombinase/integrase [Limnoglobus roseus]|uniref:Site-specific integrase n=1 Tax=Limnoglobus roseus TaxID=2598579 RepID=A0A5C1ACS6_9BACT|nr:site-specific integrase [Limnoglobus roseus]QEL14848.1 site-specific integrase [Limnoglobus roseus]
MASLQQRQGWFHLLFRYRGKQHSHALKTKDRREAEALRGTVDRLLIRIRNQEFPAPPAHADVAAYLLAGGKVPVRVEPAAVAVTLKDLADRYLAAHANGAMEANSLDTARLHLKHVRAVLGERFVARELTARELQGYLDTRGRATGKRKRPLSPVTLRKEMSTVRAVWNWGVRVQLIEGAYPGRGLTYPKGDEKPPFQTRDEIERKIARGGLTAGQARELWDCWFLTKADLAAFLAMAKASAAEPFLYPMIAFAAHSGVRRSELMRLQIDDVDLDANSAVVRERKRVRGHRSTRRVPLSGFLKGAVQDWLTRHPGGPFLFCRRPAGRGGTSPEPLRAADAKQAFRKMVRGTPWETLRGWHVLRHSFISICAAERVDQRVLQSWVGHVSAEMHSRYLHVIPNVEQQIITGVFG